MEEINKNGIQIIQYYRARGTCRLPVALRLRVLRARENSEWYMLHSARQHTTMGVRNWHDLETRFARVSFVRLSL